MNAIFSANSPLPAVLDQMSATGPGRRHRIEDFTLDATGVDHFNHLLFRLGRSQPPLDCDRLATAARELCDRQTGVAAPSCIGQRLRRGVAIAKMIADPGWEPANDAVSVAAQVIDYVRDQDDLIPDSLPQVGRLDDAIVIETAWPRLVDEIASYLDFRRLRRIEGLLRGAAEQAFGFNRANWEEARLAEHALIAHQRSVRESSYLPVASALFRVH